MVDYGEPLLLRTMFAEVHTINGKQVLDSRYIPTARDRQGYKECLADIKDRLMVCTTMSPEEFVRHHAQAYFTSLNPFSIVRYSNLADRNLDRRI
jgi:hypothetical protein